MVCGVLVARVPGQRPTPVGVSKVVHMAQMTMTRIFLVDMAHHRNVLSQIRQGARKMLRADAL